MKLTTKGRYAVTAMLDLVLHGALDASANGKKGADAVSLAAIGARQDISTAYLEQLFRGLRAGGLVAASKGPGGGYRLAKPAAEISVSDIVSAVGEGIDATRCGGAGDCQDGQECLTHGLWADLSQQIDDFLRNISLASLVAQQTTRTVAARQDKQAGRIAAQNLH